MSEKLVNAFLLFLGTFVSALVVAKVVPSAMTTMSWIDTLYSVGLQGLLVALGSLGFMAGPTQRMMGRKP